MSISIHKQHLKSLLRSHGFKDVNGELFRKYTIYGEVRVRLYECYFELSLFNIPSQYLLGYYIDYRVGVIPYLLDKLHNREDATRWLRTNIKRLTIL